MQLEDGRLVDVEMECDGRRGHGARWLYHWARLFSARLRRGDDYAGLEPVVCVVFLDARSDNRRFHSTYEAREVHDQSLLSDALAVHVVELPRLEQAPAEGEDVELQRWARFLRLGEDDDRALESLASEAPIMAEAKHALEILSREPSAQRIAEMRREAEIMRKLDRHEALAEGREEGQRALLLRQLTTRFGALPPSGVERVNGASSRELENWAERVLSATKLAEVLGG